MVKMPALHTLFVLGAGETLQMDSGDKARGYSGLWDVGVTVPIIQITTDVRKERLICHAAKHIHSFCV